MGTCTGYVEPLDIECWAINIFAGGTSIFLYVALFLTIVLSARFNIPSAAFMVLLALFGILFVQLNIGLGFLTIIIVAHFVTKGFKASVLGR